MGENAVWQQKLSNSTTSVRSRGSLHTFPLHCRHSTVGVFKWKIEKENLRKRRKKIRSEKESATESNPSLTFSATSPHSTEDSRALQSLALFLPPLAFLRSSSRLSSSPAPKAPTFPSFLLGVYGLVRPGKQRILFSLRCLLPCCCRGFCPLLGAEFVPSPFLESTPSVSCVIPFGFHSLVWKHRFLVWEGSPFEGDEFGVG